MIKISSFTKDQAEFCAANKGKVCVTGRHEYGVEIHDMRPLRERLNAPITKCGIVYTFGANHFGVTDNKLESIKFFAPVAVMEPLTIT